MGGGNEGIVMVLYAAPLMVAALWDVATFRIPNMLNLVFLALFPIAALLSPQSLAWLWHFTAFGIVLAAGFVLFSLRLLGGGDVKMLAVAALWVGWDLMLEFMIWVGIFGGVLSLALLVLRMQPLQALYVHLGGAPRLLRPKADVPYGVAIAAGGLMVAAKLPLVAI